MRRHFAASHPAPGQRVQKLAMGAQRLQTVYQQARTTGRSPNGRMQRTIPNLYGRWREHEWRLNVPVSGVNDPRHCHVFGFAAMQPPAQWRHA